MDVPTGAQSPGSSPMKAADAPPAGVQSSTTLKSDLMRQIKAMASTFTAVPEIYRRRPPGAPDAAAELRVRVADWGELRRRRELDLLQAYGAGGAGAGAPGGAPGPTFVPTGGLLRPAPAAPAAAASSGDGYAAAGGGPAAAAGGRAAGKAARSAKAKAASGGGRTYTSRYRGVHQTFPTRRWEAQFRRGGKPTSLGCFDREEEAARAYDKMMLWCELHGAGGAKGGVTNFDPAEYEPDLPWLQAVSQDDLVQLLRGDGRRQAAQRQATGGRRSSGGGGGRARAERGGPPTAAASGAAGTSETMEVTDAAAAAAMEMAMAQAMAGGLAAPAPAPPAGGGAHEGESAMPPAAPGGGGGGGGGGEAELAGP